MTLDIDLYSRFSRSNDCPSSILRGPLLRCSKTETAERSNEAARDCDNVGLICAKSSEASASLTVACRRAVRRCRAFDGQLLRVVYIARETGTEFIDEWGGGGLVILCWWRHWGSGLYVRRGWGDGERCESIIRFGNGDKDERNIGNVKSKAEICELVESYYGRRLEW